MEDHATKKEMERTVAFARVVGRVIVVRVREQ